MHLGCAAKGYFHHAILDLRLAAQNLLDGRSSDMAWRCDVAREAAGRRALGGAHLRDAVVHRLHACGELACIPHAADVHEEDLGLVEEEVVVQRSHFQAVVQRDAHRRVDFILEQHRIAHHHGGRAHWRERGPGGEPHERWHGPAIDIDLHVVAWLADLEDVFRLVVAALEAGGRFDGSGVDGLGHGRGACSEQARDQGQCGEG